MTSMYYLPGQGRPQHRDHVLAESVGLPRLCTAVKNKWYNFVQALPLVLQITPSNLDSKDLLQLLLLNPGVQVQDLWVNITMVGNHIITFIISMLGDLFKHSLDDRPHWRVQLVAHQIAHDRPLAWVPPLQAVQCSVHDDDDHYGRPLL